MHTYNHNEPKQRWEVYFVRSIAEGSYCNADWVLIKTFKTEEEAARYVNYLNGGSGSPNLDLMRLPF